MKAVETNGKGGVLAMKAVEPRGRGGVAPSSRTAGWGSARGQPGPARRSLCPGPGRSETQQKDPRSAVSIDQNVDENRRNVPGHDLQARRAWVIKRERQCRSLHFLLPFRQSLLPLLALLRPFCQILPPFLALLPPFCLCLRHCGRGAHRRRADLDRRTRRRLDRCVGDRLGNLRHLLRDRLLGRRRARCAADAGAGGAASLGAVPGRAGLRVGRRVDV